MPKQYVAKWLIDMLDSGPYSDEREVKAENRRIRENARSEVDTIWEEQRKKLAPPPPAEPLPTRDWGTPAPAPSFPSAPAPSFQGSPVSTSRGNDEFPQVDLGVEQRLAPSPSPASGYWSDDPRPEGGIETIL